MPSELNPDAPAEIWAGKYDAQAMADATGASWIAPAFALVEPRIVNLIDLCSAPPPSQAPFTTTDLIYGVVPGFDPSATRTKLYQNTDRMLWNTYCHYTDATPPPTFTANPLPEDAPAGSPDMREIDYLPEIWQYTKWLAEQTVPRAYHPGGWINATGAGQEDFALDYDGKWPVSAAGIEGQLVSAPEYQPHSDGPDDGIWWDLGWLSLASVNRMMPPVRLQRPEWIIYGQIMPIRAIAWNLSLDVEFRFRPLYPDTVEMPSG